MMAPTIRAGAPYTVLPRLTVNLPVTSVMMPKISMAKARMSHMSDLHRSHLKRRPAAGLALLDAGAGGRQHLVGAATVIGVERGPQAHHHGQIVGGKQARHEVNFLDADAMLAGDAAADRDAFFQDLVAGGEDAPHLLRVALIEEQDRMDVAVAGVKDVGDPQLVMLADSANLAQDVRQLGPRHDTVLGA